MSVQIQVFIRNTYFNKGIYACVDIFLKTFCILPCIATCYTSRMTLRWEFTMWNQNIFLSNIPIDIKWERSLDKINLHCISNISGNKWCCTAHTSFRIRWCWKQKNLKCCKISYFVYFQSFRKKLFCALAIVGIFCHVTHKIYVVSFTQQLLGNERVGIHHQWNMINVLFVNYPCNVECIVITSHLVLSMAW